MSTSRCGNICVMPPKCSHKERRCGFSNAVVLIQPCQGDAVFLGENKSTLFGLLTVDAFRNHWLRLVYNRTAQPKCSNLCNAFYGRQFCEPSRVQGWLCTKAISKIFTKKKFNSDFAMTIWRFWISDCKYVLLLVQVFAIDYSNAEFCSSHECVWERERGTHHSGVSSLNRCAAYVHIHTSIITVSWTDGKTNLKAEARDYGKGRYISNVVFGQSQCTGSVGQSEQTVLVGRRGFVENKEFERGGAYRTYNNVHYLKNNVFFEH